MPKLSIDNRPVEVDAGATVLDAAGRLGIEIPTLCHLAGHDPATSCMVCVVKVAGRDKLLPACATPAADGMRVETDTDEVRTARRTALELLLSEHLGDCMAPCHSVCPARMDIPLMLRQIAAGRDADAIRTVKRQIALPAVLGRICHRPCEKGCRRGAADGAVGICELKRYAADTDLAAAETFLPQRREPTGKTVAIVGAGAAGLSAAYYLLQSGHACTLFDDHDSPGGMLRYAVSRDELPLDVLDAEIDVIRRLGAEFRMGVTVGRDIPMSEIEDRFDAVLIAGGDTIAETVERLDLAVADGRVKADARTFQASRAGIFAAGAALRATQHAVRAVADGRFVAPSIDQHLGGEAVVGPNRPFTVHIGRPMDGEMPAFLAESAAPDAPPCAAVGYTVDQARAEALRCLHCDCRKPVACKLRQYCREYDARPRQYTGPRRPFQQDRSHPEVIFEPGKCIDCGICIRLAAAAGEEIGLTFLNRGFDVRVGVPFGGPLAKALTKSAKECVKHCPTGALSLR